MLCTGSQAKVHWNIIKLPDKTPYLQINADHKPYNCPHDWLPTTVTHTPPPPSSPTVPPQSSVFCESSLYWPHQSLLPSFSPVILSIQCIVANRFPHPQCSFRSVNKNNLTYMKYRVLVSSSPATPCNMALLNVRSLSNKTFILNDFISSFHLDFLFLMETWLKAGEHSQLLGTSTLTDQHSTHLKRRRKLLTFYSTF